MIQVKEYQKAFEQLHCLAGFLDQWSWEEDQNQRAIGSNLTERIFCTRFQYDLPYKKANVFKWANQLSNHEIDQAISYFQLTLLH